jgi:hypothetical protein
VGRWRKSPAPRIVVFEVRFLFGFGELEWLMM